MANEFGHISIGASLTQAEFELITLHQFDSQATGDIAYASSGTQLSRLGIGATDTILSVQGGVPTWRTPANILTDLTGQAGAAFSWNSQNLTSVGTIGCGAITTTAVLTLTAPDPAIKRTVNNSYMKITGGTLNDAAMIVLFGGDNANAGGLDIFTPIANGTPTTRLSFSGSVARSVCTFNLADVSFGTGYASWTEMAAPGAGAANTARIYAFEGAGDALTDLIAVFQDGSTDKFAEETTPDNSPLFTTPSGTPMHIRLRKDHPGLIRIVATFPDGEEFDLKHHEYHDAKKIAANQGCDNELPEDWFVETQEEREARLDKEVVDAVPLHI